MLKLVGLLDIPKCKEKSMSNEVEQKVKAAVAEQLGVAAEEIKNESSFMDDLGADSLDLVELVMSFENEFGITIPDEDSAQLTTVQSAITYVQSKMAN
jgi:acyl carrier protein